MKPAGKRAEQPGARVNSSKEEARRLNAYLDTVQVKIYEIHQQLVMESESITPEKIKKRFVGIAEKPVMLFDIFLEHNEQMLKLPSPENITLAIPMKCNNY